MMIVTTDRLTLREFQPDDWRAVLAYQRKPAYLRYYEWTDRSPNEVRELVGMFLDQQAQQPRIKFQLVVTLKSSGKLIGNCGVRKDSVDAVEADMGYELDPDHWGYGYATEAATAMLRFGFTELKVHRIWSHCIADNVGSTRVLEKIGMELEGRLRENEYFKGRWWDTLIYGILRHEWDG